MNILHDIRFSLRMLAKSPAFTLLAVTTLALGIGVNSMMFTIYNAAMFKGLPFDRADQIVHIGNRNFVDARDNLGVSYPDYTTYRDHATQSFTAIAALTDVRFNVSDAHAAPEQVVGSRVTPNLFPLIGQRARIGRDFSPEDARLESEPVTILSYGFWQTRYGGDPSVLGQSITINEQSHAIIGVMSEGMQFPEVSQIWIPLQEQPNRAPNLNVIGRLRDGVVLTQAQAELTGIGKNLAQAYPESNRNLEPVVMSYFDWNGPGPQDTLALNTLVGAVGFVLLIACANVGNLMLCRALQRVRETSIRIALGASRWRIVRQLLIESVLLGLLAGTVGLFLGWIGVRTFVTAVQPLGIPYWVDFSMDATTFIYLVSICVGSGLLFGLAPAVQTSRTNVNEGLKETGRSITTGTRNRRLSHALILAEIALTLVLMVGAGLMVRSLMKRQTIDIGVQPDNLTFASLTLPNAKYPQPADRIAFQDRIVERLSSVADFESFAVASHVPGGGALFRPLKVADRNIADRNGNDPNVATIVVAPGYFRSLGLTLQRGREFGAADGAPGAGVAIVNPRFAAEHWPGEDPLGKRIQLGDGVWLNVIGVSPTIRQTNFRRLDVEATAYVPYRQLPTQSFAIMARSRSGRGTAAGLLRQETAKVDANLPLFNVRTMEEFLNGLSLEQRILSMLFLTFAIIGAVLASVGIYAVTAYSVSVRTQEIGIRMALGAGEREVIWLVLRRGLKQLAVGLAIGLVGAFGVSRIIAGLLFQVAPYDLITFVSIPVILTVVIIAACWIPARRASQLDPLDALRME